VRITPLINSILAIMFFVYLLSITSLGGVSYSTLPYFTAMTIALAAAVVFALFGKYIVAAVMSRLGITFYLGRIKVDGRYAIISDADSDKKYVGFIVAKLIPRAPSVDFSEDERKVLLRSAESFLTMFSDYVYGIASIADPSINRRINRLRAKLQSLEAKKSQKGGSRYESEYERIKAELNRILASGVRTAVMFIILYASANTEDELKEKLKALATEVEQKAESIRCTAKVLSTHELADFIESIAIGRSLSVETKL